MYIYYVVYTYIYANGVNVENIMIKSYIIEKITLICFNVLQISFSESCLTIQKCFCFLIVSLLTYLLQHFPLLYLYLYVDKT